MCEVIAGYENAKCIPEEERCTEYSTEFGFYVLKMDVGRGKINERYSEAKEAKEGKYTADGKKLTAVFRVNIGHNITDTESYPLQNEEQMICNFIAKDCREKIIGIKFGNETHYLIRQEEGHPLELVSLPLDIDRRYLERLDDTRGRWFKRILELEREQVRAKIDEVIRAGEKTAGKQPKFDYIKEIGRRMKVNRKVFVEERMEGYDFREADLSDALFIGCSITNSNFSGVNLENALFINCEMKNCMFYGAMLNNCRAYFGGTVLNLEDKTRKIIS